MNIGDINATSQETGIPDFWNNAVANCFQFKPLVNANDRKILTFLKDVRTIYLPDSVSLLINFRILL